jgi:hypothetical protein
VEINYLFLSKPLSHDILHHAEFKIIFKMLHKFEFI